MEDGNGDEGDETLRKQKMKRFHSLIGFTITHLPFGPHNYTELMAVHIWMCFMARRQLINHIDSIGVFNVSVKQSQRQCTTIVGCCCTQSPIQIRNKMVTRSFHANTFPHSFVAFILCVRFIVFVSVQKHSINDALVSLYCVSGCARNMHLIRIITEPRQWAWARRTITTQIRSETDVECTRAVGMGVRLISSFRRLIEMVYS